MPLKQSNVRAFYKLDAKKGLFVQSEKNDEGKWVATNSSSAFIGNLIGFKKRVGEYEGRRKVGVQFMFNSEDGLEIVTASNNFVTASILNKLSSVKDLTNLPLEIRLYENNDFISDWTGAIGEEKGLSWKYEDNKKVKKILDNEERLDKLLKDLNSRIDSDMTQLSAMSENGDDSPEEATEKVSSQEILSGDQGAPTPEEEEDDDLPF